MFIKIFYSLVLSDWKKRFSRRHRVPSVTIKDDASIMKGYMFKKYLCPNFLSL